MICLFVNYTFSLFFQREMIDYVKFRELSLNWNALNSYFIKVLTDSRPVHVIDQLLCPIELKVSFSFTLMTPKILSLLKYCR